MIRTQFDAIIVGAGPAGSAAAIWLAQAGWSVALIEQQQFPRRKVCGECIAASNLPLIDSLGIAQEFGAVAGPELRQLSLMYKHRAVSAALPRAADALHPWGRALGRETLDRLLRDRARSAGARLLQPMKVERIEGAAGAWRVIASTVNTRLAHVLTSRLTILANGSWEPLRGSGAPPRARRGASDLFAFKANFRGASLPTGVLPVLALEGGYGGMVVAECGITTVACCIRRDRLKALRSKAPAVVAGEVVEAWLRRECAGVGVALQGASRDGPWLAAGPLAPGIRIGRDDGLFRIGNAAAEAHPIIGEGISMALQSASLLCARLLAGQYLETAPGAAWQRAIARDYAASWKRQFAPRLRLAALAAHIAMRRAPSALLPALLTQWPSLLTFAARRAGKVRPAPLAIDLAARPTVDAPGEFVTTVAPSMEQRT